MPPNKLILTYNMKKVKILAMSALLVGAMGITSCKSKAKQAECCEKAQKECCEKKDSCQKHCVHHADSTATAATPSN